MIRKQVDTAVTLDIVNPSKGEVLKNTLVGWHEFVHHAFYLISLFRGATYTRIYISKGLLRFVGLAQNPLEQSLLDRFSQSIAKDTALRCMICGQRGYRRKLEMGWPCLCTEHYIEYANDEAPSTDPES